MSELWRELIERQSPELAGALALRRVSISKKTGEMCVHLCADRLFAREEYKRVHQALSGAGIASLYAAPDATPNAAPDKRVPLVVLRLIPADGYYAYAHTPQPGSKPTDLTIFAADGETPLPGAVVFYPAGEEAPDIVDNSKIKFLYRTPTPLFVNLPADAAGTSLNCKLSLLMCSSVRCLPVTKRFTLPVPPLAPDTPKAEEQPWFTGAPVRTKALRGATASAADRPARPAPTISTPSCLMRSTARSVPHRRDGEPSRGHSAPGLGAAAGRSSAARTAARVRRSPGRR